MKKLIIFLLYVSAMVARAQGPKATIADIAWMQGHWRCENDWGISEESWLSPVGGSMSGIYRMSNKGKPVFYEFTVIEEVNGSLVFRIKHFNGDMTAWEEKGVTINFPLLSISKDELVFDGSAYKKRMVITRIPNGGMTIALDSESKTGEKSTAVFPFTKF